MLSPFVPCWIPQYWTLLRSGGAILSRRCFCHEKLDQMMLEVPSNLVFYDSMNREIKLAAVFLQLRIHEDLLPPMYCFFFWINQKQRNSKKTAYRLHSQLHLRRYANSTAYYTLFVEQLLVTWKRIQSSHIQLFLTLRKKIPVPSVIQGRK